jgi:Fe-S-cluster containining protein
LLDTFVKVTGDDHARLGALADELVWFDGTRAYMRMVDGHCSALELDTRTDTFVCSAYELRPQVCRDLERASGHCLAERDTKAERPLVALRRHKSARSPL